LSKGSIAVPKVNNWMRTESAVIYNKMNTLRTVFLLLLSNSFMTFAWYGHLKFKNAPLWLAILVSWGVAFFEYLLQVPANRWGYGDLSAYQLKIIQECITLSVFILFAFFYLGEELNVRYLVSMALVLTAVGVAFYK
jgi:uncharacterized protein (DUF486 family)